MTPEETLLDSGSKYSDIEKPIYPSIFQLFLILFSLGLGVVLIFTFKIAVLDHAGYDRLASQNKSANFPLSPPRGMITDHNGKALLQNVPVFNLLAITREIKDSSDGVSIMSKISAILGQDPQTFSTAVKEDMKNNSTFFVATDITKDQAIAVKYLQPQGFYVVSDTKRNYFEGQKFSQILGYTGKVSKDDLGDPYYYSTDLTGRLGIEGFYEKELRGEHGSIFFSKDQVNYIAKEPLPGDNIVLNIDHDLQIKLYDELHAVLSESGLSRGAGIIQDPKTGAVLALVSFPAYDNNIFSGGVSQEEYKNLFNNRAKPLFNRIVSGLYNPGSTIKPFIGMTALQEKVITPSDTITDCVSLTVPNPFNPSSPYVFKNWRTDYGLFNLRRSIANSCNIFFFTVGGGHDKIKGLGADRIANYLKSGFADSELGIDLPGETNGFIPTPDWKLKTKGEQWYLGDTYNTSIGQGDLLVTPLWLNGYISAIANGGTFYKPEMVGTIKDQNGSIIQSFKSTQLGQLPFSKDVINIVRDDMTETVNSGTAQILKDLPVKAAAKTGTAEVVKGKSINSLFTVFAPYDNPQLAMTILIEGSASNQGLAIRAAHNVLKWYFSK